MRTKAEDDPSENIRGLSLKERVFSTNRRSVTSSTLKTHFNHDRKDRRDRDPSIARPRRVYVFAGVVTLC